MGAGKQITAFDWRRLTLGDAPGAFLLETAVRALFIYIILVVAMRLMGKRTASQLSVTELAVVVTLGAAIGVPMQVPDRGMLPGIVVLVVAVLFQRGISTMGFRSGRVNRLVDGDVSILLRDGVLDLHAMKTAGMAREHLFAALRTSGIQQLGQIRRIYLEASGQLSVLRAPQSRAGLSIVPTMDVEIRDLQQVAEGRWVCRLCGQLEASPDKPRRRCQRCQNEMWTEAMTEESQGLSEPDQRSSHHSGHHSGPS